MNVKDLLELFGELADDTADVAPLWPKKLRMFWLNEAEQQACRRARLLLDSTTPEITRVTLQVNQPWLELDPRVIFVRRMKLTDKPDPIRPALRKDMDLHIPGWEDHTGDVVGYVPDLETNKVRLYRIPEVQAFARLTVVREPLEPMTELDDTPEIAARYHYGLVYWMLFRAFSKKDAETQDDRRAADNLALFEAEFGKLSSAQDEEWIRQNHGVDDFEGLY